MKKPTIIVILGPTATGKSDLAVQLACDLNGEIISADSRQVYKGLDIGSGKITKREMKNVPHHLLDVANPKNRFSVADFQKKSYKAIDDILKRGKMPIICGGTGFYIQSIVDGIVLPEIKINKNFRAELEKKSLKELQNTLKKLDPKRFENIDKDNKVRLIRAIEIAKQIGSVPILKKSPKYNAVQIGVKWPQEKLDKRIHQRLLKRIRAGMINEAKRLHKNGLSWKRMEALGLEYKYLALFLQNKISREKMLTELETKIHQFSKRQMTWFKKDKRIIWFKPTDYSKIKKALLKAL